MPKLYPLGVLLITPPFIWEPAKYCNFFFPIKSLTSVIWPKTGPNLLEKIFWLNLFFLLWNDSINSLGDIYLYNEFKLYIGPGLFSYGSYVSRKLFENVACFRDTDSKLDLKFSSEKSVSWYLFNTVKNKS